MWLPRDSHSDLIRSAKQNTSFVEEANLKRLNLPIHHPQLLDHVGTSPATACNVCRTQPECRINDATKTRAPCRLGRKPRNQHPRRHSHYSHVGPRILRSLLLHHQHRIPTVGLPALVHSLARRENLPGNPPFLRNLTIAGATPDLRGISNQPNKY